MQNKEQIKVVNDIKDLNKILLLQKIAFKQEAIRNNDLNIPPMTQTMDEIIKEFEAGKTFLKYCEFAKIVGSVRAHIDENKICYIGRLIVHPEYQRRGIGTLLMKAIEEMFKGCKEYRLFTGEKSDYVISFYKKIGYKELYRENVGTHDLVHMKKDNKIRTFAFGQCHSDRSKNFNNKFLSQT